jgi:hypothetical protein
MSTHRSTWKERERKVARQFGAQRQICSGGMGRADQTRSDTTHPTLFIETKLRARCPVMSWYRVVERVGRCQLGRTPILAMTDATGRTLWAIAPADLAVVAKGVDTTRFHVGARTAKRYAITTLYEKTKVLADRERKTPVVALCKKGVAGFVLVMTPADAAAVATAWAAALAERERRADAQPDEA